MTSFSDGMRDPQFDFPRPLSAVRTAVRELDVALAIEKWQKRLGLSHWVIRTGDPKRFFEDRKEQQDEAYTVIKRDEFQAIVYLSPETPASQVERNTLHELLHLQLNELIDPMRQMGGFTVGEMDYFEALEERFIGRMCSALLPDVKWEPTYQRWREFFEFDLPLEAHASTQAA